MEAVFHRLKAIRSKVSARTVIDEMTGVEESEECRGKNKKTRRNVLIICYVFEIHVSLLTVSMLLHDNAFFP